MKFRDVYDNLKAKPLPIPKMARSATGAPATLATGTGAAKIANVDGSKAVAWGSTPVH